MSRLYQDNIAKYAGNNVRYFPALTHALGSLSAGIALSQLLYWHSMGHRYDGYFFKTVEEFFCETGLTKNQQLSALRVLKTRGVIETKRAGIPAKRHFKVNVYHIEQMLTTWQADITPDLREALFQLAGKRTTTTKTNAKTTQKTTSRDVRSISSTIHEMPEAPPNLSGII